MPSLATEALAGKPTHGWSLGLRSALPLLVWLAALAVATNTGWILAYRILYAFTFLLVIGLVWSAGSVFSVSVQRQPVGAVLHVGDTLAERILVRNRSWLPQMWTALEDGSDLPLHHLRQVLTYIGPRSERVFTLRSPCLRRGRYHLGPSLLSAGDPFGILCASRVTGTIASLVIYPRLFGLENLGLDGRLLQSEAVRSHRASDPTAQVSTIRQYQPGDTFSHIHWRSSARQGNLMSKEFEETPGGNVWVVLDLQREVQAGALLDWPSNGETLRPRRAAWPLLEPATAEYAVSMAASLAAYFLRHDRPVGLLAQGADPCLIQPDRGSRHLSRILDLLSVVQADGRLPLATLLATQQHNFSHFDTVCLVTPSDDEQWASAAHALALRGMRIIAILIDRSTFGGHAPFQGHGSPAQPLHAQPADQAGVSHGPSIASAVAARRLPFCLLKRDQHPEELRLVLP